MYRAILVDDEYWILEGLVRICPWEEFGFEIVGKFMDAEEALRFIEDTPVDLVVTDIRMPEFSGLDLLKASRKRNDETEFVIISGYSEFEYARAALMENALDYCLKPVKRKDIEHALERARVRLDKRRSERGRDCAERARERGSAAGALRELGINPSGSHLMAIAGRGCSDEASTDAGPLCEASLFLGGYGIFILSGSEEELTLARERANISHCESTGVSGIVPVSVAKDSLVREADMAAAGRFIYPHERFFVYTDEPNERLASLEKSLKFAIVNADTALAGQLFARVPVLFRREKLGMFHVQRLWNLIAMSVSDSGPGAEALTLRMYDDIAEEFASIEGMCQYMADALQPVLSVQSSEDGDSFKSLYEYVRQNFSERLYIGDLTKRFYLNPTYCCELFKTRTGSTFSEFITRLRMERAIELMRGESDSLQNIALAVGFSDYFYFSKAFKKYFGASPTKYMESMKQT